MKVKEVVCLSAMVPSRLPGLRYAVNPYRGCQTSCRYCYAPAVLRDPRPWGGYVEVKRNMPFVLARELKRLDRGVAGVGTVTDAYQPIEGRYRVTGTASRRSSDTTGPSPSRRSRASSCGTSTSSGGCRSATSA